MSLHYVIMAVVFILIGVVFSGWLRGLPGVSMLPQY